MRDTGKLQPFSEYHLYMHCTRASSFDGALYYEPNYFSLHMKAREWCSYDAHVKDWKAQHYGDGCRSVFEKRQLLSEGETHGL
jgi:hypothetical protein